MLRLVSPAVLVWMALLCLLAMTIGASFVFAGVTGLFVSLSIAAIKSGLIFLRYMHLAEAPVLLRIAALAALAWLLILLALLCVDYLTRGLF